jgi:uncharacterized protein YuzE
VKLEHDHEVDAAHMYLDSETVRPKKTYVCDPQEVDGQIQLDFDDAGRFIGIEVLNASRMLPESCLKTAASS